MKPFAWARKRRKPYTEAGIKRLGCARCGKQSQYRWQICSDGNNYRPICLDCDIELNRAVLEFFGHPERERLITEHEKSKGGER
jgi:hypothetical protein